MSTSNLCVQVIFLGNVCNYAQFFWSHFTGWDTWDYTVETTALNVGQVSVIGILEWTQTIVQDMLVPQTGKNAGNGRFADFTTVACSKRRFCACMLDKLFKSAKAFDFANSEKFCTAVTEMTAKCVANCLTKGFHFSFKDLEKISHYQ